MPAHTPHLSSASSAGEHGSAAPLYDAVLLGSGIFGMVEIVRGLPLTRDGRPHSVLRRRFDTAAGPKFALWAAEGPFSGGEQDYRPSGSRPVDDADDDGSIARAFEIAPAEAGARGTVD